MNRWREMLTKYAPLALKPSDKGIKIPAPNFKNKLENPSTIDTAEVYTDGSKMGTKCGSGFILKWDKQTRLGMSYNGETFSKGHRPCH